MISVSDILKEKGRQVWSVTPETTVFDALRLMADKNIGALVVLKGNVVAGIFSERDYARKVILKGQASKTLAVGEIMTSEVVTVRPDLRVAACMAKMSDKHIRHLPVVEAGQLVGLISIGDVVKAIISDKEFTIKQLENYISGS